MFRRSEKRPAICAFAGLAIFVAMQWSSLWATTAINSCGTTIRKAGDYSLVADLQCTGQDGIVIAADDVSLELNGHNIAGLGGNYGIRIQDSKRVEIVGPSTISGFPKDVSISGSRDLTITLLTVTGSDYGFFIEQGPQSYLSNFENNVATNNTAGFWIENGAVLIFRGNTASENVLGFVTEADSGGPDYGNIFENNTATNNREGFEVNGRDNFFRANTSTNNKDDGFILRPGARGNMIEENTADKNENVGIAAREGATHNVIRGNNAHNNFFDDLYQSGDTCVNDWENNSFGSANDSCIH